MSVMEADIEDGVRSVETEINYLLPGPEINRRFVSAGVEMNTGTYGPFTVKVRDGRAIKKHFTLDTHGFVLADHTSVVNDFYDRDEVDRLYQAEVAESVKAAAARATMVTQRPALTLDDAKEALEGLGKDLDQIASELNA